MPVKPVSGWKCGKAAVADCRCVHISQHLAPMAIDAGFDVTVIDLRTTFANEERFPGIDLVSDWPQELADRVLDAQTAL